MSIELHDGMVVNYNSIKKNYEVTYKGKIMKLSANDFNSLYDNNDFYYLFRYFRYHMDHMETTNKQIEKPKKTLSSKLTYWQKIKTEIGGK